MCRRELAPYTSVAPLSAKRLKKSSTERTEWRVFPWIILLGVGPVALAALLISSSSCADLYDVTPETAEEGAKPVAWRTLGGLVSAPGGPVAARPDLFQAEVQVAGYMVEFGGSQVQDGSVKRFLLVPNPGNWLHPPHLDSDEVIDVTLKDGATTPLLERQAMIVRGILSVDPMELNPGEAIYHLKATRVRLFRNSSLLLRSATYRLPPMPSRSASESLTKYGDTTGSRSASWRILSRMVRQSNKIRPGTQVVIRCSNRSTCKSLSLSTP
jgi:hypothetical protein